MLPFLNLNNWRLAYIPVKTIGQPRILPGAKLAGVSGFEPELSVLETDVLTVNTIPLQTKPEFHKSCLTWFRDAADACGTYCKIF